jgi:hypothetical protein
VNLAGEKKAGIRAQLKRPGLQMVIIFVHGAVKTSSGVLPAMRFKL